MRLLHKSPSLSGTHVERDSSHKRLSLRETCVTCDSHIVRVFYNFKWCGSLSFATVVKKLCPKIWRDPMSRVNVAYCRYFICQVLHFALTGWRCPAGFTYPIAHGRAEQAEDAKDARLSCRQRIESASRPQPGHWPGRPVICKCRKMGGRQIWSDPISLVTVAYGQYAIMSSHELFDFLTDGPWEETAKIQQRPSAPTEPDDGSSSRDE